MDIDELTIGQLKQLQGLISAQTDAVAGLNNFIGKKVIIRTYSAGVWFGTLSEKSGKEVILKDARRMWRWFAQKGISLSECSVHGINHKESRICEPVAVIWLEAIEIIPCTVAAIESLESAEHANP